MPFPGDGFAQCPDPGTVIFPGQEGTALQASLRTTYRPPVGLSYAGARDVMFTELDNEAGTVRGLYTGFAVLVDPESTSPRSDAFEQGVNTEHVWPRSKGTGSLPAEADLHHLFPTEIRANNDRAAHPFDEIPDEVTDWWYLLARKESAPDLESIDLYSELDQTHPSPSYTGRWEPREERKGDVARAMFYIWTVYRGEAQSADAAFFDIQKDVLWAWHLADPVSDAEYTRTCAIAPYQDDKPNPFVIDPTLVHRAYFPQVPVRLAAFEAHAVPGAVRLIWSTTAESDHAGFHVWRDGAGGMRRITRALVRPGEAYRVVDGGGVAGQDYAYWLEATARDGSRERFGPRHVRYPDPVMPLRVRPNPARVGEPVRISTGGAEGVVATLFDVSGRSVKQWAASPAQGLHWDGRLGSGTFAPAGLYLLRVHAAGRVRTTRIVVLP